MFTDSGMSGRLAEEHRRELLLEAERERLATQAHMDQPTLFTYVRLGASGLLFALGRLLQPREVRQYQTAKVPQSPC